MFLCKNKTVKIILLFVELFKNHLKDIFVYFSNGVSHMILVTTITFFSLNIFCKVFSEISNESAEGSWNLSYYQNKQKKSQWLMKYRKYYYYSLSQLSHVQYDYVQQIQLDACVITIYCQAWLYFRLWWTFQPRYFLRHLRLVIINGIASLILSQYC